MSVEQSSKNLGIASFYIGISATSNIARALRQFLTSIKYANVKYGEQQYKDYLKVKGHRFKSDTKLARVALDVKKSDIERISVNDTDKAIIKEYAIKYGMDFALTKKPSDFDNLIKKKFVDKVEMTGQEEKIIKAFTYRDAKGKIIMDAENPDIPLINDNKYMLTISTVDLARWEIICREMEANSHIPTFNDRMKDAINLVKINSIKNKEKVKQLFQKKMERGD